MSSLEEGRWRADGGSPGGDAARRLAAALLQGASALLAGLAARLRAAPAERESDPRFEFHAEAGAPEGALYVDGRFVGWIAGVRRL